jgi:hypothetical protein
VTAKAKAARAINLIIRFLYVDGQHNTFVDWVKTTLKNGAARFTTKVWPGLVLCGQGLPVREPNLLSRQGRRDHDAPGF